MKIQNPKRSSVPDKSVYIDWLDFCKREKLNVIPCMFMEKTPAIGTWLPYQKTMSTEVERTEWFLSGAQRNVAVVTGAVSGNLVVLDFDDPKAFKKLFKSTEGLSNETLVVETGKGIHVYYFLDYTPPNIKIRHFGIDVKGEGGYVLFPPSIHPETKKMYKSISNLSTVKIKHFNGDIVEWLLEQCVKVDKKFNPDDIREPISIETLLKPQAEGARNESAVQLATWFRLKKLTEDQTMQKLIEWNTQNTPPLTNSELETILHSAYKRKTPYHYRYVENPLETEEYTAQTKKDAEEIMKQQNIIPYVLTALEEVVGEEKTKVTLFLLNLVKESVDLSGDSSTGKNTICDAVLHLYNKDFDNNDIFKLTGASSKVLRYLKKVGTLYFAERGAYQTKGGKDEESLTEYDMKVAISEKVIRTIITVKKEEGWGYEKIETEIGNFITTSTEVNISPELQNRVWEVTTDAGKKQIESILDRTLDQVSLPPEQRINRQKEQQTIRYITRQIQKEAPKQYIIPYSRLLKPIFNLIPRANRDVKKLLSAIYASAILHYKTRPVKTDNQVIVCTPQDFLNAWTFMDEAIIGTFMGETKRFKDIWKKVKELEEANITVDADTLMQATGLTRNRCNDWLKKFTSQGLGIIETYPKSRSYYFKSGATNSGGVRIVLKLSDFYDAFDKWSMIYSSDYLSTNTPVEVEKNLNEAIEIELWKSPVDRCIVDKRKLLMGNSHSDNGNNHPLPSSNGYATAEDKADWLTKQEHGKNSA